MGKPILEVRNLKTHFTTERGLAKAVDGVSFDIYPGETVGVVGESGCGKSMTALSIMRLVREPGRVVGGEVRLAGEDVLSKSEREMRRLRGRRMAMIFQDPLTTLNPVLRVGRQVTEALRVHGAGSWERGLQLLEQVGISGPAERMRAYPHELSGGMRQRVMIAIALSCNPDLLLADEPTTALDVTIQAQILDLMKRMQQEKGTSILLITHDFGVVSEMCDRVLVMYAGHVVEAAPLDALLNEPGHPYTQGLLASIPRFGNKAHQVRPIVGVVPELHDLPAGCHFSTRCPWADDYCVAVAPELESTGGPHYVACHKADHVRGAEGIVSDIVLDGGTEGTAGA